NVELAVYPSPEFSIGGTRFRLPIEPEPELGSGSGDLEPLLPKVEPSWPPILTDILSSVQNFFELVDKYADFADGVGKLFDLVGDVPLLGQINELIKGADRIKKAVTKFLDLPPEKGYDHNPSRERI